MFFDLVKKNSKRNRKENGMFFVSLIVSIIAFYIILSLENQDVIIFLKEMESDAINRLLLLTPVLYAVSLFILFFLVYFAGKYQLERRSHELGMYLMLGMRRKKLFLMLLMEEIYNSMLSLLIGIPISIFISEMISMITARVVGIGIIGHRFSFSIEAVLWTVLGFLLIRLVALLILSGSIAKKDIDKLILQSQEKKHKVHNKLFTTIKLLLGIALLFIAYGLSINGYAWQSMESMGITVVLGIGGTFLIFHGMVVLFEIILKNRKNKNGLEVFTFRQLQENAFYKSNSLVISSLLVLIALCCFGYGISVTFNSSSKNEHVLDYTFTGDEKEIKKELNKFEIKDYINEVFDVKVGDLYHKGDDLNEEADFSVEKLIDAIKKEKESKDKENLLNSLGNFTEPFLFSLSGYNKILIAAGKEPIRLKDNQAALFNGLEFSFGKSAEIINNALKKNISVEIEDKQFDLVDKLYQDNIVAESSIHISYAFIVPDKQFDILTRGDSTSYWNATLKDHVVKEKGLMQSIRHVNQLLDKTNLEYESYLQNMGRQLFYTVAATYTTIYLAVIFLIMANTVIGVQFLMQQQNTSRRYQTMVRIGCNYNQLRKSSRKQIKWYFSLPILVAAIGSVFGIRGLFSGISTTAMKGNISELMIIAVTTVIILCVIEFSYMICVMKTSDKHIYELMDIKRDDN
ncbi:ABC transporter permease [Terrisporobacter petrolearius]|uniref:FtsX-like permease family protein n=1 Tax=Terrisporobacter petrolearius TaxID=1460447 RepID=UPI001D16F5C5|nr:FtsX-like permease family protein [Terrisporobacter petrolearius]MCC3865230.1 ABC transporter permease [Terrisporobacter petrolearius]